MRIVALDLSLTATGVADNRHCPVAPSTLRPPRNLSSVQRLEWMLRRVVEATQGADLVVIEGYAFARPNQAHQIGELGGVIRLALYTRHVPFVEVAPSALKKLATGKGNAKKEAVLVAAVKRLAYLGDDNNQADALWLLQAALIHYDLFGRVELPKTHLESLAKVGWPARERVEAA